MATVESLKLDLNMLMKTFTKDHECFQISQAATDQLTCRFICKNGKISDIHATVPVNISLFLYSFYVLISNIFCVGGHKPTWNIVQNVSCRTTVQNMSIVLSFGFSSNI